MLDNNITAPIAPLQLESPIGQFLTQILVSHPHLVPSAVDQQQLEQLQTDRDAQEQNEEPSTETTDLVLYKRIAEVKANERKKALEEIFCALVVRKFMDANVSLVPSITPSPPTYPAQDDKLELLHSPEALEMIQNHLALILGNRAGEASSIAEISKLRVSQVYAASVMYGYFLKRVDQLEKSTKVLPEGIDRADSNIRQQASGDERVPSSHPKSLLGQQSNTGGFDKKEAVSIIEKHTEALFGKPEIVITPVDFSKDEVIKISFGGLRRLVLEAVTFGSFLWDVESYVDSRYHFVAN
ncbi:hypothetical protein HanOQP8_Chr09g0320901 [Helianthus annuus]|nr:hypothetical protein HanIR_Chr09g0413991 [Helianthus annuus]KAJ0707152.1 hypothetical protein HanLR1_Chr09g0315321 [Helianthus annuus]KAJ0711173.1 hypothetical protein HanOQP8_Chr09g0320901 [Helianthus annuus]